MIVLAMNREGYRNLCRLVSAGYREGFHYKPRVDKELLRELNDGLIALSGCLRGEVAHNLLLGQFERARAAAEEMAGIFDGRYYLEVQDNRLAKQEQVNGELKALGDAPRVCRSSGPTTATTSGPRTPRRTRCCSASRPARRSPTSGAGSSRPTSST